MRSNGLEQVSLDLNPDRWSEGMEATNHLIYFRPAVRGDQEL
jgi:hypothetical protein